MPLGLYDEQAAAPPEMMPEETYKSSFGMGLSDIIVRPEDVYAYYDTSYDLPDFDDLLNYDACQDDA